MKTVTKAGSTYDYKYAGAAQDEVLQQQSGSSTYQLVYGRVSQTGQPVVEQVKINANTAYVENDPVTGQPIALRSSNGIETLYVYNGTGTPAALLTDFASVSYAYAFDPYGVPVMTTNGGGSGPAQNPFLFSGGIQDRATGWVHFGARWYDPATGRWTQQDTLDTPLNPANANRYAYAGGDPISQIDPTGQITKAQLCRYGPPALNTAISAVTTVGGAAALASLLGVVTAPVGGFAAIVTFTLDLYLGGANSALGFSCA